jgi:nicotinamidase-related amidase
MNTLLVIDMQNAWLNGGTERHDKDGVVARINHAAHCMRERGDQVIFIRHCDDEATIGSAAWNVDAGLVVQHADLTVDKTACDSFADTELLAKLHASGAETVFICGLATEFCVDTTLRAALSHGFDVIGLSDAHTTGDRPHLTAAQIIEHHNWTWANMAAPTGRQVHMRTVKQAFPD